MSEWSTVDHPGTFYTCIKPYSKYRDNFAPVRAWALLTSSINQTVTKFIT